MSFVDSDNNLHQIMNTLGYAPKSEATDNLMSCNDNLSGKKCDFGANNAFAYNNPTKTAVATQPDPLDAWEDKVFGTKLDRSKQAMIQNILSRAIDQIIEIRKDRSIPDDHNLRNTGQMTNPTYPAVTEPKIASVSAPRQQTATAKRRQSREFKQSLENIRRKKEYLDELERRQQIVASWRANGGKPDTGYVASFEHATSSHSSLISGDKGQYDYYKTLITNPVPPPPPPHPQFASQINSTKSSSNLNQMYGDPGAVAGNTTCSPTTDAQKYVLNFTQIVNCPAPPNASVNTGYKPTYNNLLYSEGPPIDTQSLLTNVSPAVNPASYTTQINSKQGYELAPAGHTMTNLNTQNVPYVNAGINPVYGYYPVNQVTVPVAYQIPTENVPTYGNSVQNFNSISNQSVTGPALVQNLNQSDHTNYNAASSQMMNSSALNSAYTNNLNQSQSVSYASAFNSTVNYSIPQPPIVNTSTIEQSGYTNFNATINSVVNSALQPALLNFNAIDSAAQRKSGPTINSIANHSVPRPSPINVNTVAQSENQKYGPAFNSAANPGINYTAHTNVTNQSVYTPVATSVVNIGPPYQDYVTSENQSVRRNKVVNIGPPYQDYATSENQSVRRNKVVNKGPPPPYQDYVNSENQSVSRNNGSVLNPLNRPTPPAPLQWIDGNVYSAPALIRNQSKRGQNGPAKKPSAKRTNSQPDRATSYQLDSRNYDATLNPSANYAKPRPIQVDARDRLDRRTYDPTLNPTANCGPPQSVPVNTINQSDVMNRNLSANCGPPQPTPVNTINQSDVMNRNLSANCGPPQPAPVNTRNLSDVINHNLSANCGPPQLAPVNTINQSDVINYTTANCGPPQLTPVNTRNQSDRNITAKCGPPVLIPVNTKNQSDRNITAKCGPPKLIPINTRNQIDSIDLDITANCGPSQPAVVNNTNQSDVMNHNQTANCGPSQPSPVNATNQSDVMNHYHSVITKNRDAKPNNAKSADQPEIRNSVITNPIANPDVPFPAKAYITAGNDPENKDYVLVVDLAKEDVASDVLQTLNSMPVPESKINGQPLNPSAGCVTSRDPDDEATASSPMIQTNDYEIIQQQLDLAKSLKLTIRVNGKVTKRVNQERCEVKKHKKAKLNDNLENSDESTSNIDAAKMKKREYRRKYYRKLKERRKADEMVAFISEMDLFEDIS